MQTIIIKLDPAKLENADLDLRYYVPERIEEISNGTIPLKLNLLQML